MMESVQRIRYPSFDYSNIDPSSIPIIEVIVRSDSKPPTPFRIGNEEGWMVEWRGKKTGDDLLPIIDSVTTTATLPFLMRTRDGWYIEPDSIHAIARKLIAPTVVILIMSLLLHAIAPVISQNSILLQSYQIGPLDYPLLLLITFPIFVLPIIMRSFANYRDINNQNYYIQNPLDEPEIDLKIGNGNVTINSMKMPEGVIVEAARLQVGVAVPERESILKALGRDEKEQPPPGMSTPLPERRIASVEEHGTGVGEAIPMPIAHSRVLILEPLRVCSRGELVNLNGGGSCTLQGPEERWPGSIYSSLIALHWELIVYVQRSGAKMQWVKPIIMQGPEEEINIEKLPLMSSRAEISEK